MTEKTRLADLEPRWLEWEGRKVGMMLRCPHCRTTWLSCFFEAGIPTFGGAERRMPNQFGLFETVIGDAADEAIPCDKAAAWKRNGDDFATMSVTPSLDASAAGHWHGSITNGEVA